MASATYSGPVQASTVYFLLYCSSFLGSWAGELSGLFAKHPSLRLRSPWFYRTCEAPKSVYHGGVHRIVSNTIKEWAIKRRFSINPFGKIKILRYFKKLLILNHLVLGAEFICQVLLKQSTPPLSVRTEIIMQGTLFPTINAPPQETSGAGLLERSNTQIWSPKSKLACTSPDSYFYTIVLGLYFSSKDVSLHTHPTGSPTRSNEMVSLPSAAQALQNL